LSSFDLVGLISSPFGSGKMIIRPFVLFLRLAVEGIIGWRCALSHFEDTFLGNMGMIFDSGKEMGLVKYLLPDTGKHLVHP